MSKSEKNIIILIVMKLGAKFVLKIGAMIGVISGVKKKTSIKAELVV